MDIEKPELKPCPFCGGKSEESVSKDFKKGCEPDGRCDFLADWRFDFTHTITCFKCGATLSKPRNPKAYSCSAGLVISAWNTRQGGK